MGVIKNHDDLLSVKEEYLKRQKFYRRQALVYGGAGCVPSNYGEVRDALIKSVSTYELDSEAKVMVTECMGTCTMGPAILAESEGTFYAEVSPEKTEDVVARHLLKDEVCEEYTYLDEDEGVHVSRMKGIPFLRGQVRVVLRNCGHTEYASPEACISRDGCDALARALSEMTPVQTMEEMKAVGPRGRGGIGFPTGVKWEAGMRAVSEDGREFMVCNAGEGDPGAFVDRNILKGDSHSIIEGMMLGGYAIGASRGYVYVRAEYPTAVERLGNAIDQARKAGIPGENVMGSGFPFGLEIRIGAGTFVYGEETSLLASIGGKRGEPRQKSSFPFKKGLFESLTIINNVETLANTTPIILGGSQWHRGFGTEKSAGTKVFALAGDTVNVGIIGVPIGTILGDIIYRVGGGIIEGKEFKATQSGGPSGGCLTKTHLSIPCPLYTSSSPRDITL